jgi:hypothetical protein
MRPRISIFSVIGASLLFACSAALAAERTVTVSAGDFDRRQTPVAFELPKGVADDAPAAAGAWALHDDAGNSLPVQVDGPSHVARFILPELKANQTRTYRLTALERLAPAQREVTAASHQGVVTISVGDQPVLGYQSKKTDPPPGFAPQYARGGYLFPLYTPAGRLVSDDYPPNHKHHHGIWAPWTKTEFEGRHPDFWNMGDKTGTVEPVALDATWSGPVAAGFRARHRFVDLSAKPEPKAALNEEWIVQVYNLPAGSKGEQKEAAGAPAYRLFDWQSTQTTASESPLILPKYYYGGLGFRGAREWDGPGDKCRLLTSEGKTRANGNETRARWCRISGDVAGKPASVIILCHPDNFRSPQPVRLHPSEPFFCYAPQQLGEFRIEPGKPYVMSYRFATSDGEPDAKEIERLWNDYAKPPKVEVK